MKNKSLIYQGKIIRILTIGMLSIFFFTTVQAQNKDHFVRIVNLEVDSVDLESFNAALTADIETAVRTEPGVLTLHAMYDKNNPTHITVFEIYANEEAHKLHQQTPHFMKYRQATQGMAKAVVRTEMVPIVLAAKPDL